MQSEFALMGRGCDVLEKNSGHFLHLPSYEEIPGKLTVLCIDESPDGSIWLGTTNGLLKVNWKINMDEKPSSPELNASANIELASIGNSIGLDAFNTISANGDGTLLLSIEQDGIYHFNPAQSLLDPVIKHDNYGRGRFIGEISQGRKWTAYTDVTNHLMLIENGNIREIADWKDLPQSGAGVISKDNNLIWATRVARETFIYSMPEAELQRTGTYGQTELIAKLNMQCASMHMDNGGNLWIGTSGYGLRKIKLSHQPFQHFLPGPVPGPGTA